VAVQEDFWQECCSLPKKSTCPSFVAFGVRLLGFVLFDLWGFSGQKQFDQLGQRCVLEEIFLEQVFL
jgi:hypothetical protein